MALIKYKPRTPGTRGLIKVDRSHLHKGGPRMALTAHQSKTGGRNHFGRITTRHHGGGTRQKYRIIDFKRDKDGLAGVVERLEYDPNRTAFIALIKYQDGELAYILAPQRLSPGDTIVAGEHVDVKSGNAMPLGNIPIGTIVHNIELKLGKGGQIALITGRAEQLPFPDGHFDALTFTYLLRYVSDPQATLAELGRVLKPGGTMASLEFCVPTGMVWGPAWWAYTRLALPAGGLLLGGPEWYRVGRFLGPNISAHYRRYPVSWTVQAWQKAGFTEVGTRIMSLGGGLVMWGTRADS